MKAEFTYELTPAGQKAAIMAGRPATQRVVEQFEVEPWMLDRLGVTAKGELYYTAGIRMVYPEVWLRLDAPPANAAEVIEKFEHIKAERVKAEEEEQKVKEEARKVRQEKERADEEARALFAASKQDEIEAAIASYEAGGDLMGLIFWHGYRELRGGQDGQSGSGWAVGLTDEQFNRICAVQDAKAAKDRAEREAKAKAVQDMLAAEIAEHGGYRFEVEGGYCSFQKRNLWKNNQDNRWVGVFTSAKGIDSFLPNPRGEHTFQVTGLSQGDCIQGAGFDKSRSGRRSNESEFFGVVVKVDDKEIVVREVGSRAEAFKVQAKIAEEWAAR